MIEYAYISFPEQLAGIAKAVRKEQGLSQAELAQRSGTSQRFVSEFERGKQSAELGKVLQVLEALGLKFAVTSVRSPEESKALVHDGIARIQAELAESLQHRTLAQILEAQNG